LGLLLRHAEHSVGPAGARERLDGFPDERALEGAARDRHPGDEPPQELSAWDAWDGAHPDATDAAVLRPEPADAGAEKLAALARDARAQDASFRQARQPVQLERLASAAELCIPDAVQFAEQSCAELVAAPEVQRQEAELDAARLPVAAVRQMLQPEAQAVPPQTEQAQVDVVVLEPLE
jgi:hypothetical protein